MRHLKSMISRIFCCLRPISATLVMILLALSFSSTVSAQKPTEDAPGVFPLQKHFSPYAGRNFPTVVYWGDTHLPHSVRGSCQRMPTALPEVKR